MAVETRKPVATKNVSRQPLQFSSYDEILEYARKLSQGPTRQLGNWSLGQICRHLAVAIDSTIDGPAFKPAIWLRLLGPMLKKRFLSRPMPSGFKLPKNGASMIPSPTDDEVGLQLLDKAIRRLRQTSLRAPHGLFGKMTNEEWDQLHFRHCAMHLSFIEPA
jgi:Protein of unknown function (DUF1569)